MLLLKRKKQERERKKTRGVPLASPSGPPLGIPSPPEPFPLEKNQYRQKKMKREKKKFPHGESNPGRLGENQVS